MANEKESQLGMLGLSLAALEGLFTGEGRGLTERAGSGVLDYLNEMELTEADSLYLRDKARSFATTPASASMGTWSEKGMINAAMGRQGMYQGQSLYDLEYIMTARNPEEFEEKQDYVLSRYAEHGIKEAPKLVDILLGYTTPYDENMRETDLRPSGGYPFRGDKVYDLSDYAVVDAVFADNEYALRDEVLNLKMGESINLTNRLDARADIFSSVDLGRYSSSIGKDEVGFYVAIADIFDVSNSTQAGELVEFAGSNPVNLYGRFYFNEKDIDDFILYDDARN
ncbi:MAG: hypothetical protein GOVbin2066_45 [Prokaryotic dsDNA virus sp.]|nr:MAG: hypothetical protein GOVbin2066_45 [Prokaryotic dsDNA virus sp.]|tara:strand:- start:166 stop:1014 length:849 start_codon:yes stop_codon:yes gene_type:complete